MKKVLIIDDESSLRKALMARLMQENFEVMEASNGAEGIEMIREFKPEVTLLDIAMPKVGGLEVLMKIRDDVSIPKTRIIMMTNSGDISTIADSVVLGVTNYIVKSDHTLEKIVQEVKAG
jgi:DNA-binding NtrC family response regulator